MTLAALLMSVLALLVVGLLTWARRFRGWARCPHCGAVLPNAGSPRCPACGESI